MCTCTAWKYLFFISPEQELASAQAKNYQMQQIYEEQDMTTADVERLKSARQDLQRQEESLEKEVEGIDSQAWKQEQSIARLLEKASISFSTFIYCLYFPSSNFLGFFGLTNCFTLAFIYVFREEKTQGLSLD